ncbi:NUDIX hydrolase [Candidatus Daviesbacteria bacterium]|nr:NUDIX hydrolase [Candidatus Daviesbacteria bacterium]
MKPKTPPGAKKVFKGQIFDVYQWEQEMYDGSTHTFEKIVRPDTVLVIPVTQDGKIIICEQEQPHRDKAYLSLISGRVEENELPEDAARRELLEETGFEAGELILWDEYLPGTKIGWTIYTYVAKNCKKVAEQNLDPGERITCNLISFDEFIELLVDKKVDDIHLTVKALEAKLNPKKMEELKKVLYT